MALPHRSEGRKAPSSNNAAPHERRSLTPTANKTPVTLRPSRSLKKVRRSFEESPAPIIKNDVRHIEIPVRHDDNLVSDDDLDFGDDGDIELSDDVFHEDVPARQSPRNIQTAPQDDFTANDESVEDSLFSEGKTPEEYEDTPEEDVPPEESYSDNESDDGSESDSHEDSEDADDVTENESVDEADETEEEKPPHRKRNKKSSQTSPLKDKFSSFIDKLKSEVGDGSQKRDKRLDTPVEDTDEPLAENDAIEEDLSVDSPVGKKKKKDKKGGKKKGLLSKLLYPSKKRIISLVLIVILGLWSALNIPLGLNGSKPSFDSDGGTLTAKSISYANNKVSFDATNDSEMIAHATMQAEIYAWSPLSSFPKSLFAPVPVIECSSQYSDINPGDSKHIELACSGNGGGIWKRPVVHLIGE